MKTQPELEYICIGNNCWGKAKSPEEAIKNCKANWYSSSGEPRFRYILSRVAPETTVSEFDGALSYPADGYAPVELFRSPERKKKKAA